MNDKPVHYPDTFLRGISKGDLIIPETGGVTAELFLPNSKSAVAREDGCEDISINWEDNEDVVAFTLLLKKNESMYQFPNGLVRLNTEEIHRINSLPTMDAPLSYERNELENNPYHGNIVYKSGLTPRIKRMIATSLAISASPVVTRDNLP